VGTQLARLNHGAHHGMRDTALVRLLSGEAAEVAADALSRPPHVHEECRGRVLRAAELFLGTRYYWGGRSGVQRDASVGVDCSGLTSLAYRVCGLDLPRDAHEQRLLSRPLRRRDLRPGDLVFLTAGAASRRITHVMIYAGGEGLIESRQIAGLVLRCTFAERFGIPLRKLESGRLVTDLTFRPSRRRRVFFGSYF
jgi:cell wall-associated NlpC family hydrolase